jgi:hypothetical protein
MLSTWLLCILALLGLTIAAIVCIALVEVIFEHGALAQAYTVKTSSIQQAPAASTPKLEH